MLPLEKLDESARDPRQATLLLKEGVAAFRVGDKDRARELLASAAELDPGNELVWMWTASVARNRREALTALERVLELNPANDKAKQWLGRLRPVAATTPKQTPEPAETARPTLPSPQSDAEAPRAEPAVGAATADVQALAAAAARSTRTAAPAEKPAPSPEPDHKASPETVPRPTLVGKPPAQDGQPLPVRRAAPPALDDDPIRALLRAKGDPDAPAADAPRSAVAAAVVADEPAGLAAETTSAESGRPSTATEQTPAPATEQTPAPAADLRPAPADAAGGEPDEASKTAPSARAARPISTETCLLCGKRSLEEGVCGYCRAVGDISKLDEISRNEHVDRTMMLTAVERYRKELEAGPSFEANLGLALAYLNLKQSNDALPRLRDACRLQPEHAELRRQYDRLKSRKLILAVDDSKTVQKMIAGVLESKLYRVALAEDGLQALARLDDEIPSLILLDITMPRMDGYQVSKIITGNAATASIPVVMLSGKDGFFDRIRGKLAGATGYLTKPFDPDDLIETIERCLNG